MRTKFQDTMFFTARIVSTIEGDGETMAQIQPLVEEYGIDIYKTLNGTHGVGSVLIYTGGEVDKYALVVGCENCGNIDHDKICIQLEDGVFKYVIPEDLKHAYKDWR